MTKPKTVKSHQQGRAAGRTAKGKATALANARRERESFRSIVMQSQSAEQARDREAADAAIREADARLAAAGFDLAELRGRA